jgi:hypothetical protein
LLRLCSAGLSTLLSTTLLDHHYLRSAARLCPHLPLYSLRLPADTLSTARLCKQNRSETKKENRKYR